MATKASVINAPVEFIRTVCARIPTDYGEFQLCHFANTRDFKEHLAFIYGEVSGGEDVPVRVHSECFTGDVLGSRRCDCGDQLHYAMAHIAEAGRGVIIYLRQEGRGIGLEHKLQAYNLQDEGYDTVEANLLLGHQADEREYWAAAAILNDLNIRSLQLLTNNPSKIEHLRALGVNVTARVPVLVEVNADNRAYLTTKAQRMRHILTLAAEGPQPHTDDFAADPAEPADRITGAPAPRADDPVAEQLDALKARMAAFPNPRPFVTLTYAQSLNGALAGPQGRQARISGDAAMQITHQLRAAHDAILVGVGTLLADDPILTLRLAPGRSPQPVILDSHLRTPTTARILGNPRPPLIATLASNAASDQADALRRAGASLLYLPADAGGRVSLPQLLAELNARGLRSLMVEGGAQVIAAFLTQRLVDAIIVTVAPRLLAGVATLPQGSAADGALPNLRDVVWTPAGADLILWGAPAWEA